MTEVMLRLLGLDYVADSLVGGKHFRGISGGQKKRLTTAEMTVGAVQLLLLRALASIWNGPQSLSSFRVVPNKIVCHPSIAPQSLDMMDTS